LLYNFNDSIDCKTNATLMTKLGQLANTLLYMALLQQQLKKVTSLPT
jgi:hypothetical protein